MAVQQSGKRRSVKGESKSSKKNSKKGSPSRARANASEVKKGKQPKKHRWLHVVIAAIVVVVVVVLAAFSWDRWFRFDDAADIQGSWQAAGQAAVVEIDGEQMHLTDEVAYDYVLDTGAKTIEFSFGKLAGSGTYRFSEDRATLTIIEGAGPNIVRDFFLMFGLDIGAGEDADKPTTVFVRASDGAAPELPEQNEGQADAGDSAADADAAADAGAGTGTGQGEAPNDGESSGAGVGDAVDNGEGTEPNPGESPDAGASEGDVGMLSGPINDRGVA